MVLELDPNHVADGEAKLLSQFKNSPKFRALLRSYLRQIQKLENAIWEVITIRGIAASEGVGLDVIGRVVKRARLGLSDGDYRLALRAQIRINRSSGSPIDILAITGLSLPDGASYFLTPYFPATILITIPDNVGANIQLLYDNLRRAKMGGVALFLIYALDPEENTFTFSSSDSVEINADRGFDGGHFVGMV